MAGGGAWIGNYKNYWQPLLEKLSKAEKIIILPSSFNDCQHFIDSIDNRYTIFCREKKSYNYLLSRNTTAKIILDYDMAFRLNESIFDSELNISFKEKLFLYVIYKKLKTLRSTVKFIRQDKEAKKTQDTDLDLSLCLVSNSIFCEDFVIFATLTLLSAIDKFDTIITDRLHIGISSILMSKKLFLLDNSYGKVFEVFNHTLPNDCNICFIENLPDKFEKNTKNGTNNIDILMHNIFC
ncbi:MAG: hypothetical protein E7005_07585 [Alphaproteobacteria bacterium]|nr:hypothetical protein [Alphaproteobacteria bacterium]